MDILHCERCNEVIRPVRVVWLELDSLTNLFHKEDEFPSNGRSQGLFAFGKACAGAVLRNDGRL